MKYRTIQLTSTLFFFAILTSFSCIGTKDYGPTVQETRKVKDFSEIEVSHGINVYISRGNSNTIEVETGKDVMDKLITEVRGEKLKIYFEESFIWVNTANVYLEAEMITRINASGGSDVIGEDELRADDMELNASGGSDIKVEVDVDNLEVEVSGGADIVVSGSANYLEADASGGSDLKAYDLIAQSARLEASGGADIKVYVQEELDARASGGADIKYKGNPKNIQSRDSSGGDVTHVN